MDLCRVVTSLGTRAKTSQQPSMFLIRVVAFLDLALGRKLTFEGLLPLQASLQVTLQAANSLSKALRFLASHFLFLFPHFLFPFFHFLFPFPHFLFLLKISTLRHDMTSHGEGRNYDVINPRRACTLRVTEFVAYIRSRNTGYETTHDQYERNQGSKNNVADFAKSAAFKSYNVKTKRANILISFGNIDQVPPTSGVTRSRKDDSQDLLRFWTGPLPAFLTSMHGLQLLALHRLNRSRVRFL